MVLAVHIWNPFIPVVGSLLASATDTHHSRFSQHRLGSWFSRATHVYSLIRQTPVTAS